LSAAEIDAELSDFPAPSSHVIVSASRATLARHQLSATTATPSVICTTCFTPGMDLALAASMLTGLPPMTGHGASEAYSMQGRGVDRPLLRRRLHGHLARRGAGDAHLVVAFGHRSRTAGELAPEHGVDVRLAGGRDLDLDLLQVDLELLGHQRGHRGVDALAH